MRRSEVAWELWAVALFGLFLHFFYYSNTTSTNVMSTATNTTSAPSIGATLVHDLSAVLPIVGLLLTFAALTAIVLGVFRLFMRRRRMEAMVAEEILLGPDDVASPAEVVAALDAIHTALLTRYGSPALGQVSWTFEIIRDRDGQIHFVIAAPFRWISVIEDNFRNVYTNLRFQPWGDIDRAWPVAQQIVLTRTWTIPTRIDDTYQNSVVEMIVQALDRANGEVRLQWLMTPLPVGPLAAQLRASLRYSEYQERAQQQMDPAHPGLASSVSRQDIGQGLELLGRSAFQTEVRLAADDWETMQRVYGALAAANAANQWHAKTVVLFKGLWTRWLNHRVPSLAFFGSTILFSKPLATVIHVPSARLRVQSLSRVLVRRGPAPPTIPRDPALAILRDEQGPVGIPESDRKYNVLFIGSQGGGKSTGMLQLIRVDAHWRDAQKRPKALVIIDIGKDTAKRALGLIPRDREVVWFDPADPACPWTINPIQAGVSDSALANDVLESLTQVFGDDAIRARSREFLGNATLAVKEVHGDTADFTMVYKMLTDDAFRQYVIDHVQDPHQQEYWQVTFTQTVAANPRFVEEGLAAPRNKLDEVLRTESVRLALTTGHGRRQLDMRDIVEGRKVLVANLDKARLGKSGARLLGVFLITMLWHALQLQNNKPEADRVPTSLVIDEAQNFISEGFLDILAEGRAYGAQTTLAVRFLGEILSERAILGVRTLVQNLIIYQFELREDAEDFMRRFMRTYSNFISPSDEVQDRINFGADDFMRLPKHHVVCRWMVNGSPQPAFLAETIPWESDYDDATRQYHLAQQPHIEPTTADADRPLSAATPDEADTIDAAPVAQSFSPEPQPPSPPVPDPPPDGWPPPAYLRWLVPDHPLSALWDADTGAALAPVWAKAREYPGQRLVWQLSGPAVTGPWRQVVRQRAAAVARELAGPDGVVAWVTADQLGVWLPPDVPCDPADWQSAAAAHNVTWYRIDDTAPAAAPTAENAVEAPASAETPPPSIPVENPDVTNLWRVLERQCGLTANQVRQWQQQQQATDQDVIATVRWMIERHIPATRAALTFQQVLRMKAEDHALDPICKRLKVSRKVLRDAILGHGDVMDWVQWINRHPEITTIDQLRAAVAARERRRGAS